MCATGSPGLPVSGPAPAAQNLKLSAGHALPPSPRARALRSVASSRKTVASKMFEMHVLVKHRGLLEWGGHK